MSRKRHADVPDERWQKLWSLVRRDESSHPVEEWQLGEYADLLRSRGPDEADREFPAVGAHLAAECAGCAEDLREILETLAWESEQTSPTAVESISLTPPNAQLVPRAPDRHIVRDVSPTQTLARSRG